MSRAVTLDAVPITAVTIRTGKIWIYPGHVKAEKIKPVVCAEHGLEPDHHLVIWHATFDTKDIAGAVEMLKKTAKQLREVAFK